MIEKPKMLIGSVSIAIPILIGLIIVSMVAGYFGGNLINFEMSYPDNNTFEISGVAVLNSKEVLPVGQLRMGISNATLVSFGASDAVTFGISKTLKIGKQLVIEYKDDNLNYVKNGAKLTLICKEGLDTFFACEYKVAQKQLCPIPTPTPKPTPKPTAKPAVKK
jgi:hypothetical protein